MIQRGSQVVIRMLADVKQATIGPLLRKAVAPGTAVFTDEYDIYARLPQWGYTHRTVCRPAAGQGAAGVIDRAACSTLESRMSHRPTAGRPASRPGRRGPTAPDRSPI